ncbi:hypothetical protein ACEWY4_019649 [Coilia grayii]|uniref:Uncharacterized protein n=1 Tax=Coilia grayii TaxID=363190 RepID=A0ABD1JAB1_9TELE
MSALFPEDGQGRLLESPVCVSVNGLFPEDARGRLLDASCCTPSSSFLHLDSDTHMAKAVQFVCDHDSRHDSIKTTASTRTPTPFPSPRSSVTSLEEAEATGESSVCDEALAENPGTSKGKDLPGLGLHQRVDDGHSEPVSTHQMEKSTSAASTQKRFTFMERFGRMSPVLPHGRPKLSLTQRPALGRRIQMMRDVLTDLFRSCPCSCSDQVVVAVTVVPSNSGEIRPAKARHSPERIQLAL